MSPSHLWRKTIISLFIAATLFCPLLIGFAQAQSAAPNSLQALRDSLGAAINVHQRHSRELMADPDVVGTAVGLTANGQPAIKVFTRSESIMRFPTNLEGLPVEVEATGAFHALAARENGVAPEAARVPTNPRKEFPLPVPIGVSIGNENDCSAGTIGARVKDPQGNVYALSNNHVFALENKASLLNSNIVQPGLADTRCRVASTNFIGTLTAFVPIEFSTSARNTVDAAIAISDLDHLGNATIKKGYGTPQSETVPVSRDLIGENVQKFGEASQLTKGQVTGIHATVLVDYDSGTAQFVEQIVVESRKPFIKAGDSGSLLVTNPDANPVGLLFAGDKTGRMAVANPIDAVLGALGVSIDGD
jgi:hypothetical protein